MRRVDCAVGLALVMAAMTATMDAERKSDQPTVASRRTAARPATPRVQLLHRGNFHGDEITSRSGETWLGLFPVKQGFALYPTTILVSAVPDPMADENDRSGRRVALRDSTTPIFLVKGASRLHPGPVPTVFAGDLSLGGDSHIVLTFAGDEYRLYVNSDNLENMEHHALPQHCELTLTRGAEKGQNLFSVTSHDDAHWRLHWAGDVDGDGKLDFYLDLSTHYNVSEHRLFLSSAAGKGEIVREVALFRTVGC